MKKIINKKVYNTETAKFIAEEHYGSSANDATYYYEQLYKTKKGAWFIYGEGGALSPFGQTDGNMSFGSSDIRVLSYAEAYRWLENNELTKEIEKYFPDEIEEA